MDRNDTKEAIKDSLDLVDIVSRYTVLHPAGKKLKGLSPFTNEKTPSFFVDPIDGVYYCFSSQKGGDIFTFIQEMEGVDFKEALKLLAEMAGIPLTSSSAGDDRTLLYQVLEKSVETYKQHLTDEIKEFLLNRGLTSDSIRRWEVGYAPNQFNTICSKSTKNKDAFVKTGICVLKGQSIYDRFRDRIMFPFHNTQGKYIGFSGRAYGPTDMGKYINSPETPLFNKSKFLYGLYFAKQNIRKTGRAMLTEGQFDTILAHQVGFPIAVAASGTAITEEHLRQLYPLAKKLFLAFDSDSAGVQATIKVIHLGLEMGFDMRVLVFPKGKDPADVINENPEDFKESVKQAKTITEFILLHIHKTYGDRTEGKIQGVKEILFPLILRTPDSMVKANMIKETSKYLGLTESVVEESLMQTKTKETDTHIMRRIKVSQSTPKSKDKVMEYINEVSMAETYLRSENVSLPDEIRDLLSKVKKQIENFSETEESVARLKYEHIFPESDRIEKVIFSLKTSLRLLDVELRRRRELKKIKPDAHTTINPNSNTT